MGTTTNHAFRYPEDANVVAVPADIKKLADDLDAKVISSAGGTVSGNIAFTGTTIVQTPSASNHASTKAYVDNSISAIGTVSSILLGLVRNNPVLDGGTAHGEYDEMWDIVLGDEPSECGTPSAGSPSFEFDGGTP